MELSLGVKKLVSKFFLMLLVLESAVLKFLLMFDMQHNLCTTWWPQAKIYKLQM